MVSAEEYNALYEHYQDVAGTLFLLLLLAIALWLIFVALYSKERQRRRMLQAEIDRQQSPAHQLELIQSLGAAGREEMRRVVAEAHQALVTLGGGTPR